MQVVILAGGLGTRLGSYTKDKPKSLVDVDGKPFIAHQIDYLLTQKVISKILLCLGHYGEQVENFIKYKYNPKIAIEYSYDGASSLGTAGAIKKAENFLEKHFFVLYGDSYLPVNYEKILNNYFTQNKLALMTIYRNNNKGESSNILYRNGNIELYQKNSNLKGMMHIDYGLNIFSRSIFEGITRDVKVDLSEIHSHLIKKGELAGMIVDERYYEIGSVKGLKETESFLIARKNELY